MTSRPPEANHNSLQTSSSDNTPTPKSRREKQKTPEQQEIIHSEAQCLVVNAFAGTGKTTTLVDYALQRPRESILYLAFNRSVKEDAQKRFPPNVRCVTTHGLAYRDFGSLYKDKLGNPKPASVAKMLKCNYLIANAACESVNNFLCSPDAKLDPSHLSGAGLSNNNAEIAFHTAKSLWEKMQDLSNPYVRMPHDGYLKLYQLSKPRINSSIIMVDEAQDSNMMVVDMISRQSGRKIYVGDQNQAIYGFRKAVDALNKVEADSRLYLTSSFRFGAGVASLATLLLRDWKGESRDILGLGPSKTTFSVNENKPHAVLARTNSGLFDAAVKALRSGHPFGYVGGYEGYRLDMIMDAYSLKKGFKNLTDPTILLFPSFKELESYADTVDDKELKMLIRVIDKYGQDIPYLIGQLRTQSVKTFTGNEIILSTAHKAKGMEFESVVLLDDYTDLKTTLNEKGQEKEPLTEDINILYVAATRAAANLKLNDKTTAWLVGLDMVNQVQKGQRITGFEGKSHKQIQALKDRLNNRD